MLDTGSSALRERIENNLAGEYIEGTALGSVLGIFERRHPQEKKVRESVAGLLGVAR